jgi:hypothetical protein
MEDEENKNVVKELTYDYLPFDVCFTEYELVLFSSVAKSLVRNCWFADRALWTLLKLRNMSIEKRVAELGRIIYQEIKPLEDKLRAECTRINSLYEKSNIKYSGFRKKPKKFIVSLRFPESQIFFDLLAGLDNMACQLEDLRSVGKIPEIEYKKTLSNSHRSLKKAALGIKNLVGEAIKQAGIILSSGVAKSLRRILWMGDKSFYNLDVELRKRITEEQVEILDRIVYDEILKPLEERLQAEYRMVQLLCERYGIKPSRKKSENITVHVRQPDGHRFYDLLIGLDNMICQLDDLRLAGKISGKEYQETVSNYLKSLKEAELGIRSQVSAAIKQAGI